MKSRPGILSGESAIREVAAFYLDKDGIHGVPPTSYVELGHSFFESKEHVTTPHHHLHHTFKDEFTNRKEGSFQVFMPHQDMVGNYGPSLFTVKEVQKIAILDIRIINVDRNEENILVNKWIP